MDGLSKTDEVLALLNKRERGEGPKPASAAAFDEHLGFTDFLPSPAAAVLHKLQRISAQPRSDQPKPVIHTINRTPSDALKVVLGEQRPEPRKLRYPACLYLSGVCIAQLWMCEKQRKEQSQEGLQLLNQMLLHVYCKQ